MSAKKSWKQSEKFKIIKWVLEIHKNTILKKKKRYDSQSVIKWLFWPHEEEKIDNNGWFYEKRIIGTK